MDKKEAVLFLFTVARELKRSFENPVILLTLKDYADGIFNSLVDMRNALLGNASSKQVAEIVNTFHLQWLQDVQEIENFKKRAKDTPRKAILKAIDYTIECVTRRYQNFQRVLENSQKNMSTEEKHTMKSEVDIIGDMRDIANYALVEKQKCLRYSADKTELYVIIVNEIEELMNWLDRLNDHLAMQMSEFLHLKIPGNLVKTLQQIINEIANCPNVETQETIKELSDKNKKLSSVVRRNSLHGLEICKVAEKIKNLEDRINLLKIKDSPAVMALEHKAMYLQERLQSLQNLKLSLNCLKIQKSHNHQDGDIKDDELHIFNHLLPHPERCRLVERLVKIWNSSIRVGEGVDTKPLISILSASDIKEVFSDDLGLFTVDKHGRKIYTTDEDEHFYQLNERNELITLQDDDKHVYFYDDCGRYYLNNNRERVYKAHKSASEYLHQAGFMFKLNEFEEGIEFQYDNLGRFYIDENGIRIYRNKDSQDEYIHDELGNLVRIRDDKFNYHLCPSEPMVTEDSKYLKETVGVALKKCIASAVVVQPSDPIRYLADKLEKYRQDIETSLSKSINIEDLMNERERYIVEPQRTKSSRTQSFSLCLPEASMTDVHFTQYVSTALDL